MDEIHVPAALTVMLLLIAAYAIVFDSTSGIASFGDQGNIDNTDDLFDSCINGTIQVCNIGVCNGTRTCIDDGWAICALSKVCIPGSYAPCSDTICTQSLKKCDECGSGYSLCFNNSGEVG